MSNNSNKQVIFSSIAWYCGEMILSYEQIVIARSVNCGKKKA